MYVYRISLTRYAKDLGGEGARLNGGRWNHIGIPCLYTAESRALAALEYAANVSLDDMPRALSIATIEIPDNSWIEKSIPQLPGDWADPSTPVSTRDFGSSLLRGAKHLVVKLPSAVIHQEFNYIINPLHPAISDVRIIAIADFAFDVRVKK